MLPPLTPPSPSSSLSSSSSGSSSSSSSSEPRRRESAPFPSRHQCCSAGCSLLLLLLLFLLLRCCGSSTVRQLPLFLPPPSLALPRAVLCGAELHRNCVTLLGERKRASSGPSSEEIPAGWQTTGQRSRRGRGEEDFLLHIIASEPGETYRKRKNLKKKIPSHINLMRERFPRFGAEFALWSSLNQTWRSTVHCALSGSTGMSEKNETRKLALSWIKSLKSNGCCVLIPIITLFTPTGWSFCSTTTSSSAGLVKLETCDQGGSKGFA